MTPLEMQMAFRQQLKSRGLELPVGSFDVFYFLNLAQDELVRSRYAARNRTGTGFQESQEVIDDLEKILLKNVSIPTVYETAFSYKGFHADKAPLPADRLRMITFRTKSRYDRTGISWTIQSSQRISAGAVKDGLVRIVQSDDIYRLLEDPYNQPTVHEPLGHQSQEHIIIYTNTTFVVNNVVISYLKRPQRIIRGATDGADQPCELPEILHQEVVQSAIMMYINSNTTEQTPS